LLFVRDWQLQYFVSIFFANQLRAFPLPLFRFPEILPPSSAATGGPMDCTKIGPDCPVEASIYGYYPSLSVNVFFCAAFAACMLIQTAQLFKWKIYTYGLAMTMGCLAESIGMILHLWK
jgi:hypothetical protein